MFHFCLAENIFANVFQDNQIPSISPAHFSEFVPAKQIHLFEKITKFIVTDCGGETFTPID